jgi:hypothetical protein
MTKCFYQHRCMHTLQQPSGGAVFIHLTFRTSQTLPSTNKNSSSLTAGSWPVHQRGAGQHSCSSERGGCLSGPAGAESVLIFHSPGAAQPAHCDQHGPLKPRLPAPLPSKPRPLLKVWAFIWQTCQCQAEPAATSHCCNFVCEVDKTLF